MLCMLGTQTAVSLLMKQPSDEEAIGSLASGWLLLVKALSVGPRLSASAFIREKGVLSGFEYEFMGIPRCFLLSIIGYFLEIKNSQRKFTKESNLSATCTCKSGSNVDKVKSDKEKQIYPLKAPRRSSILSLKTTNHCQPVQQPVTKRRACNYVG